MTIERIPFRPRARLIELLGEQLVSDPVVGLIELVKNGYDADATLVVVKVEPPSNKGPGLISVLDDGFGMSRDDLVGRWMSPGDGYKSDLKRQQIRSPRGRLPIGEKGVGRFAVQLLGRRLELVTEQDGGDEVVASVEWDNFSSETAFLDDLAVEIEVRRRSGVIPEGHGTLVCVTGLREAWESRALERLTRALRRLQNPFGALHGDFAIRLEALGVTPGEGDPTDLLERAHYRFDGVVDAERRLSWTYTCSHPGVPTRDEAGTEDLRAGEEGVPCGPFGVRLRVWDREARHMRSSGIARADLDDLAGVTVYRDGLRVLPYGEKGNDWLDLDRNRIQNPSGRIGNNQVIGCVELDQTDNPLLLDRTSREGFIENGAFLTLRSSTKLAVRVFESLWSADRPGSRRHTPVPAPSLPDLPAARELVNEIARTADPTAKVDVPANLLPAGPTGTVPAPSQEGRVTIFQTEALEAARDHIDAASSIFDDEREGWRQLADLAATGQAAIRAAHEIHRHLAAVQGALACSPADVGTAVASIRALDEELRLLAPPGRVGRRQRPVRVRVADIVDVAVRLGQPRIADAGVTLVIEDPADVCIRTRPTPLLQILDNLIDNAVYWAAANYQRRTPAVAVRITQGASFVLDSGPGISPVLGPQRIFELFETMKPDGSGIGLHLARSLADDLGCRLSVISDAELTIGESLGGAILSLTHPAAEDPE